ncbi:MAG: hypothetical protein M1835_006384 [Candelina submexicana]|nr:MAG: hypothetical protein M1835_006384 [Candelina submexicana]
MDSSYLTSQVATITAQLHGLFDDIGVPIHERESRELELFNALSEALHNQLRLVAAEKNEMTEEANHIIKTIKQMEASLDDSIAENNYDLEDEELKVSFPLVRCLQTLKEKHVAISKIHRERFEQVKKLVQALESYSSHLESSFVKIQLPPTSSTGSVPPTFNLSPSYVSNLDNEFTRVYDEYTRRVALVKANSEEIVKLWAELGTPQAQTDSMIVKYYRDSPEQLGLHQDDLNRLKDKLEKLLEEKRGRERRLKEFKAAVESLWDRLGVEEQDRKRFLASNRGCGMRAINEFEDELNRLNELKRQNLHLFVEDARYKLQELWDALYFSEEDMLEFTPAFSDVYSDALLSAHEAEIVRLETLKEQRAPTLQLIDRHRSLIKDREDLAASSQDASRLMNRGNKGEKRDPTRLLREEKMRKRITKELPKIEVELRKTLERWEDEYGRPFMVHGERYLDELAASANKTLPPRSKTPSGPAPSTKAISSAPPPRASSTMRGIPPPRSGAKTPTGPVARNPVVSSVSTAGGRTPSKIPARAPLGTMRHGGNSPERRARPESRQEIGTLRKVAPPAKAPPPKMRDLFMPPPASNSMGRYEHDGQRSGSVASSDESVRPVSPEDVYDDVERTSYLQSSMIQSQRSTPQSYHDLKPAYGARHYLHDQTIGIAASRQISTTSSATNTVSGSENWETYDDASDPEPDASETYYAKLRAARGKRFTPDGGYTPPHGGQGKKTKSIRAIGMGTETLIEEEAGGQLVRVSGSEAGWTDEDAF